MAAPPATSSQRVVETVRRRWPAREIALVYTDQPRNDFNALVGTIHGAAPVDGVYPLFSATSFHRQILPSGSLDLGFSATAMHWLSAKPCDISDHVQAVGASGAELAAFARQGNADWQTILLQRARELRPGGRLVLVNFCRDEEGRYLGRTGGVDMFGTFNLIWRELLESGTIGESEYRAMTLPQYYKTLGEFTRPLTDAEDPVIQGGAAPRAGRDADRPLPLCRRIPPTRAMPRPSPRPISPRSAPGPKAPSSPGSTPPGRWRSADRIIDGYYARLRSNGCARPRGPWHGLCPRLSDHRACVTPRRVE